MSDIKYTSSCPYGHSCESIKGDTIDRCKLYIRLSGINPNTGETEDSWNCSFAWTPILLIENSMQQRSTSAAVESFRNEMVQNSEVNQQILLAAANKNTEKLISNI